MGSTDYTLSLRANQLAMFSDKSTCSVSCDGTIGWERCLAEPEQTQSTDTLVKFRDEKQSIHDRLVQAQHEAAHPDCVQPASSSGCLRCRSRCCCPGCERTTRTSRPTATLSPTLGSSPRKRQPSPAANALIEGRRNYERMELWVMEA